VGAPLWGADGTNYGQIDRGPFTPARTGGGGDKMEAATSRQLMESAAVKFQLSWKLSKKGLKEARGG